MLDNDFLEKCLEDEKVLIILQNYYHKNIDKIKGKKLI